MATADFNDSYRPCIEQNGTALRNKDLASSGTSPPLDEKIEPIAVIGFSARLPQEATTGEAFWRMLSEGRSAMTDIPKERFNVDAFYHPNADRTDAVSYTPFKSLTYIFHHMSRCSPAVNRPMSKLATS